MKSLNACTYSFFFFQAEDGIRDYKVTGVQTCALPICIARAVSSYVASTGVNMTIGTPQYLSPEQAQGRPLDERVDFYALGVTLFKAATGEVPFASTDWFELARMHVEAAPPALRKRRPELSRRFERVVMKCLAKHPDDRYRDATQLLADLEKVDGKPPAGWWARWRGWWSS